MSPVRGNIFSFNCIFVPTGVYSGSGGTGDDARYRLSGGGSIVAVFETPP